MLTGGAATPVRAADWPQILGPSRNGQIDEPAIDAATITAGPRIAWQRPVGSGYAGVALQGDSLALFHRTGDNDLVELCDRDSGRSRWSLPFRTQFEPSIVEDDGPRCVPTLTANEVVTCSAAGTLAVTERATGKLRWSHQLLKEFGASAGYFGCGSTPLVTNELVIVNAGGRQQAAGVVAFDLKSGEVRWQAVRDDAGYSAPVLVAEGQQATVLVVSRLKFSGLDLATGRELFSLPFGQRGPTVNAALPVVHQDRVLLTASYGIGAQWLRWDRNSAEVLWSDPVVSSQYATPIFDNDTIYAVDGRQDGGPVSLKCIDPATHAVHWSTPLEDYATLIANRTQLLVVQTDGTLLLVELSPKEFRLLAKTRLTRRTVRALPAYSAGRLYVRDDQNLFAFQLAEPAR